MQHIPYRGSAPALQALLSGEVDVVFDALAPTMGQIKAGKLRALGLAMARRSPALPDLKTMGEQGIAGVEAYTWAGLYAPAGTSAAIVQPPERRAAEVAQGSRERARRSASSATSCSPRRPPNSRRTPRPS